MVEGRVRDQSDRVNVKNINGEHIVLGETCVLKVYYGVHPPDWITLCLEITLWLRMLALIAAAKCTRVFSEHVCVWPWFVCAQIFQVYWPRSCTRVALRELRLPIRMQLLHWARFANVVCYAAGAYAIQIPERAYRPHMQTYSHIGAVKNVSIKSTGWFLLNWLLSEYKPQRTHWLVVFFVVFHFSYIIYIIKLLKYNLC